MPTFKNLKDLLRYVEKNAASVLRNEVAQVAREEMSIAVKEDVYEQYTPSGDYPYIRRGDNGGLSDVRNMTVEIIDDTTISITNDTSENPRYGGSSFKPIDHIIVSGTGYTWKESRIYKLQPFPRDFYAGTIIRLKKNKRHIEAMKQGLKRRGFNVK